MLNLSTIVLTFVIVLYGGFQVWNINANKKLKSHYCHNPKLFHKYTIRCRMAIVFLIVSIVVLITYLSLTALSVNMRGYDVMTVVILLTLDSWEDAIVNMIKVYRHRKSLKEAEN